jgi:hypothetical protein
MNKLVIAATAATFVLLVAISKAQSQPPPAPSDTLAIVHPGDKPTTFFWLRIAVCAKDERHPHYAYCRSWIDAREEGKKEAR